MTQDGILWYSVHRDETNKIYVEVFNFGICIDDGIRLLGDVDGDGEVTILDATFIQRWLTNIPIPFEFDQTVADSDGDGEVIVIDATLIQRWLANLPSNDNIGKPIV